MASHALPPPARLIRKQSRHTILPEVAELIRELGLERSREVLAGTSKSNGAPQLVCFPINTAASHVWSMDRLMQRLEFFAHLDEMLELERTASAWFFERLSSPGRGSRGREVEFARGVREQEWSLFDRVAIRLDEPVAARYLEADLPGPPLPAPQRRMATGLLRSVPGAFFVERREGDTSIFRNPSNGRRFEVLEHSTETRYKTGDLGLGRLIPLPDGPWLRSPGMILFTPPNPELVAELAEGLERYGGQRPAVPLEMAISALAFGVQDLPRRVRPAEGAAVARVRLQRLTGLLRELGLAQEVSEEEAPPALRDRKAAHAERELRYESYDVDEVLAEWLAALTPMARSAGRGVSGKKSKKRRR